MGDSDFQSSPAYGPVGVLAGAAVWSGTKYILNKYQCTFGKDMINTLVALVLTGAYAYMWNEGNPHDGELKDNLLELDIPLMLAGGYYLSSMYPMESGAKALFNLLNVAWIISLFMNQKGSNIGDIFGFMMEAQNVFSVAVKILTCNEFHECAILISKYASVAAYAATRLLGAGYTIMKLAEKEDAPMHIKILGGLTYVLSLAFIVNFIDTVKTGEQPPTRGRSRSRSTSRPRSRSRTPKRRR